MKRQISLKVHWLGSWPIIININLNIKYLNVRIMEISAPKEGLEINILCEF